MPFQALNRHISISKLFPNEESLGILHFFTEHCAYCTVYDSISQMVGYTFHTLGGGAWHQSHHSCLAILHFSSLCQGKGQEAVLCTQLVKYVFLSSLSASHSSSPVLVGWGWILNSFVASKFLSPALLLAAFLLEDWAGQLFQVCVPLFKMFIMFKASLH